MSSTTIVLIVAAAVVFGILWWQGQVRRLAIYVQETREELKKCAWPTWTELKGSTTVIVITIALLGLLTYAADLVFTVVFQRVIF
ncbi:MAG: preprotein translocase subunit SecE [Verrucomicrobia bacterium]|nr:preprotein translocase subunit SecE [Verrucomicrobiota bacterium]MDE3098270.1 preprotein translocase subunit SecE [Verrucomicrobiota bacterium]